MKKTKIKALLDKLSPFDTGIESVFSTLDKEIADVQSKLKETITAKTLEEVNEQFRKLKKLFEPLAGSFAELRESLKERDQKLVEAIQEKLKTLNNNISEVNNSTNEGFKLTNENISNVESSLSSRIKSLEEEEITLPDYTIPIDEAETRLRELIAKLEKDIKDKSDIKKLQKDLEGFSASLKKVQESAGRGGSANRQINVNSSVMSTVFTDINFVSDSAIRWSATNDTTNKRVNIQASLISGGAGGSATPAGNNTEVQFNDNGAFGASSIFTWNGTTLVVGGGNGSHTLSGVPVVSNIEAHSEGLSDLGGVTIHRHTDINDFGGHEIFLKSRGSHTNPGSVKSGDYIARIIGAGFDGTDYEVGSEIRYTVDGTVSNNIVPQAIRVLTSPTGLGGLVERMTFDSDGDIHMGNSFTYASSVLTLGQQGSVKGNLTLSGATTGTVQIITASTAGNWVMTLPPTDGSANQVLTTDGNGVTAWASVAATGGTGITRTSSIITADTLADDTASIDRVFVATNSLNFTLPDATANLNLYTLKNATDSSVLVTAVGGDTIDGSGSVLVLINNQSLDFISDNSAWRII